MRLRKLFLCTTLLLLTLMTILLLHASWQEYQSYRAAKDGLHVMRLTRLAMAVAEKASFERDPANGLMSGDAQSLAGTLEQMSKARQATDAAFDEAFAALKPQTADPVPGSSAAAMHMATGALMRARELLRRGRQQIDRAVTLPQAGGKRNAVAAANHTLSRVVDVVFEAVAVLAGYAGRVYPDLVDALVASQMAGELREQAGRLGAHMTLALRPQMPLQSDEVRDILLVRGRIDQLLNLIWLRNFVGNLDAWQSAELAEVRLRFVATGLPLVKSLAELGAEGRPYGMNVEGFAAIYAPSMQSIVALRDTLFRIADEGGRAAYGKTLRNMLLHLAIGLMVMLVEIAVFLFIRRRVLRPLIDTNAALVDISRGQLDVTLPPGTRDDEIGDMIHAAAALRVTSLEKRALEQERERRIEDLTEASSIDPLTGLINRRAFFERALAQLATATRHQWPVTVIALDIDHFKSINDRYGHALGDTVLVQVAHCITAASRAQDVAARFGGEEFVVMAVECDAEAGHTLAERLRTAVASSLFKSNDSHFKVTVSAGVVTLPSSEISDIQIVLKHADDALYAAKEQGRNRTVVAKPPPPPPPPAA